MYSPLLSFPNILKSTESMFVFLLEIILAKENASAVLKGSCELFVTKFTNSNLVKVSLVVRASSRDEYIFGTALNHIYQKMEVSMTCWKYRIFA